MDTKRMITGMVLAMTVILGYNLFINWLWKRNNWKLPSADVPTTQVAQATPTTGPSSEPTTGAAPTLSTAPSANQATAPAPTTGIRVVSDEPTTMPVLLGSAAEKDQLYAMQIQINPQAAGVDGVTLNQFKLKQGKPDPYSFEHPADFGPADRALGSRSVIINGQTIDLSNVTWSAERSNDSDAYYYVDIEDSGKPLARVRKTFHLDNRPDTKGKSEGYELDVTLAIENRSGAPITASTSFNGPLPPRPEAATMDRTLLGAYKNGEEIELIHHVIEELKPDKPTQDLTVNAKTNHLAVWTGIGGTYFNGIVRPLTSSNNLDPSQYLKTIEARAVNPSTTKLHPDVAITYTTADQKIEPGSTFSVPMKVFFGPKQRSLLNSAYYSAPLVEFNETLVMTSGPCAFCTFTWLIDVLVNMMRAFHVVLRDWGLAIIALVCVVRLVLHPITKKSQVNMMKMSKMGPEVERLKKKYGDDKEAMGKAQMELYKEMGFTPVLGCLPMFLQMPIFIALWQALQSTFELRQAPFLWGFTWIKDLSQPDRLINFGTSIPLVFGWHIDAINILPVLVAIVSFLNMKYTPRPPAATPEAEQQQKMMQWMTLIFPLFFYSFPSGLNIYYLTSTSLGIWEGKRIRAHIKEQEEAEKAGKVIVDASPRSRTKALKTEARPEPKGGIAGWLAKLQEKAEQVKNEASKKK